MNLLQNLDLLSVGIAIAGTVVLGFTVYFNNSRSITNKTFLLFCLVTATWGALNYFSYQIHNLDIAFWLLRLEIALALWQAVLLFQLFYAFPKETLVFFRSYKTIILPVVVFVSIISLTSLVFRSIKDITPDGKIATLNIGPGIILFAIVSVGLVLAGWLALYKKTLSVRNGEKKRLWFFLIGGVAMFSPIIVLNFIFPAFLNNSRFVPFGAVSILPFIVFTSYAILKHKLLNIRVTGIAVLVFLLSVATFFEVILTREWPLIIYRSLVLFLVLIFGTLLIRSVLSEIKKREESESLSEKFQTVNIELRSAYEKLEKLDKAKSEFISIASHQLRTPLSAIKGYISMILEGTYGHLKDKTKKPLQNVYRANERLVKLVNDLLNLSRIEAGKVESEMEETSLEEIITQAIEILKIGAKNKNLYLKFEKPKLSLPRLWLDKQKTVQAILNVIDNAIRYTKKGGITITIKKEDSTPAKALIEIKDTGVGISSEELSGLFESFSRGHAGAQYWTEGAGLGLYIAQKFIDLHHGKIWAESDGANKGSSFFIELPIKQK